MPLPLLIGGAALLGGALLAAASSSGGNYDDDDDGEDLEEARREKARSEILTSLSEYLEKEGNQLMSVLTEQGILEPTSCSFETDDIDLDDELEICVFDRDDMKESQFELLLDEAIEDMDHYRDHEVNLFKQTIRYKYLNRIQPDAQSVFQRVSVNFYSLYKNSLYSNGFTLTEEFRQDMRLLSKIDKELYKIKQQADT
ncbi:hypothetical protein [Moraxella nasicaprae]|uniref:Uncharacterized protein n=1 Tax=Moraxella nasicaprae TaxID=2904122 RepID=A0ABY6F3U8_9GAMM|nr:hypothetical protein [Moraxella nasicaprae]UXZ04667.1 hypothetical protein LU297_08875 [Moraxella nasicaprae]